MLAAEEGQVVEIVNRYLLSVIGKTRKNLSKRARRENREPLSVIRCPYSS